PLTRPIAPDCAPIPWAPPVSRAPRTAHSFWPRRGPFCARSNRAKRAAMSAAPQYVPSPTPDLAKIERALISVSDKAGLVELGRALAGHGIEILSTGGSAKALREAGLKVVEVSDHTGS